MTKEEYEKLQKTLTRVVDPETGRHRYPNLRNHLTFSYCSIHIQYRLIRGTGEIVEELVSRVRHQTINKEATKTDGETFYKQSLAQAAKNVWGK